MRYVFIVALVVIFGTFLAGCGEQSTPSKVETPSKAVTIPIPTYSKPSAISSPDPLPTAPDIKGK